MAQPGTVVSIREKCAAIHQLWSPKIVAEANGWHVKLVKAAGEFVWHAHEETDEIFMVISGELVVGLRDGQARLGPGDIYVVPRGVEHRPDAGSGCEMMLLEPIGVPNTGDVVDRLSAVDEWI
jgi:mannose-6-phosphate isomerase-like protein (cupin superfamily)